MSNEQKYWFPAKRYGWGWGVPCAWQGWVVLLAFFGLLAAGALLLLPAKGGTAFFAYTAALGAILVAICWFKGERPRWRWGSK